MDVNTDYDWKVHQVEVGEADRECSAICYNMLNIRLTLTNSARASASRILRGKDERLHGTMIHVCLPPTTTERLRRPLLVRFAKAET